MIDNHSYLFWLRRLAVLLVFAMGLVSIIATGGSDVTINGSVTGSGGIANVIVSAGGSSVNSDLNGYYELTNVPVPSDGLLVLTYEKAGYATFQRTISVTANNSYSVTAKLLPYHYSEQVVADNEQNLDIQDPNNPDGDPLAQLSFPAGSLGSGDVTVNVAVGDPTTDEGRRTFPGDYMAAATQGGEIDTPLESVVFTEITILDANGDEITEASEPVLVTLRLPDSLQTAYSAGDTIEWWSYDEVSASWVREDADPATSGLDNAMVIDQGGVLYAQAKVMHFTWWNVDRPMDQLSCLCTTVVDQNDLPLSGAQLIAEGISYNSRSRPANTDTNGKACVTVKRSTANVTEQVRLFVESGNVQFPYDVTNADEGDVASDAISTPTIEGSTIYNSGQCVDLNNNIALRYDGRVTGQVTFEGGNVPVSDYVISSSFGSSATTDSEGNYELFVPLNVPVTLFVVGQLAETVTVVDAGTPEVVNFAIENRAPVIDSVSRAPEGLVANNQAVNLSVTAHDDDGDSLTYSWSTLQGSFNSTTTSSVTWTAPATGAGTATLTITVTDGKGGETSQDIAIVYAGATPSGESLSFIIKDDFWSDQPVAGVVVALYNTDNLTIAQTLISDANGVVDFGDINRTRATFTIAYEYNIDTFMSMQVADDIIYYIDDYEFDNRPGTSVATVDYSLSAVPMNPGFASIQPGGAWWNFSNNSGRLTNSYVSDRYLQDDGNLSLLARLRGASNTDQLIAYGFLLDQTVTEGASYDIALNRVPLPTGWSTQPATDLRRVNISGFRSGVRYYDLGGDSTNDYGPGLGSAGTLPLSAEFPVDKYRVYSYSGASFVSGLSSTKRYSSLPQSVEIPMPDYSFSNLAFDSTTKTFSWSVSGSTPQDVLSVEFEAVMSAVTRVLWSITMDPSVTSWQVMELPAPANTWIDTEAWRDIYYGSVSVEDFDFVSGLDETWQFLLTGGSLKQTYNQIFSGWAYVPGYDGPYSVREKGTELQAFTSKRSAETSSTDGRRMLPAGLSKLRRQ